MKIDWRALGFRVGSCPACGQSPFVRFAADEMGVRCLGCRATPVSLSLLAVLREILPDLGSIHAYELSSRGPVARFLRRRARALTCSEYFEGAAPGTIVRGVRCENVSRLSFASESFDLCTSTEVFEHVADDAAGFAELHRVLRPGGLLAFTVPLSGRKRTVERAVVRDGRVEHLLPPEFHSDRIRGSRQVLCYRNYGEDILGRLSEAGFPSATFASPKADWFGFARPVIVARKASLAGEPEA